MYVCYQNIRFTGSKYPKKRLVYCFRTKLLLVGLSASVVLFWPKYQLGHPKICLFSLSNKIVSGSKCPCILIHVYWFWTKRHCCLQLGGPMLRSVRELGLVGLSTADVPPSPSSTSSECSERLTKPSFHPQIITVPHSVTALEAFRRFASSYFCIRVGMLLPCHCFCSQG